MYSTGTLRRFTMFISVLACMTSTAWALPADQLVEYRIRETPTNELSDVIYTVTFHLVAKEQNGNSVSWIIESCSIVEDPGGLYERSWTDVTPLGVERWVVEHQDANDPKASEFTNTPAIESSASADDPEDDDLVYEVDGESCQCSPSYDGDSTSLSFEFTEYGESTPIEDGEDEPVEVDIDELV